VLRHICCVKRPVLHKNNHTRIVETFFV